MKKIYQEMIKICEGQSQDAVLALVVATEGSSPRASGSRMLVRQDGSIHGTIGGGSVEKKVIESAMRMFHERISHLCEKFSLSDRPIEAVATGMLCGGTMTVFLELLRGGDRLFIYGGGHIGHALAPIARECGFNVWVVDDRPEITSDEYFSDVANTILQHPGEHAAALEIRKSDSIVIVTHNHKYDALVLEKFLEKTNELPRYIGMIGSRKKISVVLQQLGRKGISQDRIDSVYTPIGLDIGGENPMEISIAIMAEMMAVRNGKISNDIVNLMRCHKN